MLPPEDVGVPGKFGFFAGKNHSEGDWMTVDTGEKTLKHLSETLKYRGKSRFHVSLLITGLKIALATQVLQIMQLSF
jgi:hypothetical protein